jgi:hypothetical protein|tara:strand:- start:1043 stop:1273 length:231 start_codon:yes stop_codon:yes gene_type:complete
MTPTIENWQSNPTEIGPIYPWVGLEVWMVIAAALSCLFFLAWKLKSESRHYDQMEQQLAAGIPDAESRQHEELSNG